MYILRERLNALLTKYERWNAPIAQNVEMGNTLRDSRDLVRDALIDLVAVRDDDVHHRQFSDPELDRLEGWEGLIEGGVDPGKSGCSKVMKTKLERRVKNGSPKLKQTTQELAA